MPADRLFHPKLGHSVKVCSLTHLEFRVWATYELAADDYGVMRFSPITIQAANEALEQEPHDALMAALEKLATVGLVEVFEHQGRRYCCQLTWQNEQRIKHPRDTMQPAPPTEILARCTPMTRKLFEKHSALRAESVADLDTQSPADHRPIVSQPAGDEREAIGKRSGSDIRVESERVSVNTRLTANGYRLTANGKEVVQGESAPMDVWARELVDLYPAQGRCGWNLVERPLYQALTDGGGDVRAAWAAMKARLESQKRSAQWRAGKIPRLDRWLSAGLHLQELPEADAQAASKPATARWAGWREAQERKATGTEGGGR